MPGPSGETKVSVILTTHNGADRLKTTLPAVFEAMLRVNGAEFLLVDNASTDDTVDTVAGIAERTPSIEVTVIRESRRGKSFGLNRGLDLAKGDLLVFIDDDVRPIENWLSSFCEAALRFPKSSIFTGQIRPDWLSTPPDWLQYLTDLGQSYGCTPLNRVEGACSYTQAKGANLMVRRFALKDGARFDEGDRNYGASTAKGHGGEDVKFVYDALRGEENGLIFIPDAIVFHSVKPHEMRLAEVLRRYRGIGQARAGRLHAIGQANRVAPLRKVVGTALKAVFYAALLDKNKAAMYGVRAARCFGEWLGGKRAKQKVRLDASIRR